MPKRVRQDANDTAPVRVEVVPRLGLSQQEAARYIGITVAGSNLQGADRLFHQRCLSRFHHTVA